MQSAEKKPTVVVDPINGKKMHVKSVCIPTTTLLQGRPYVRARDQLGQHPTLVRSYGR